MRQSWLFVGLVAGLWACGGRTLPLGEGTTIEPIGGVGEGGSGGVSGTAGKGGSGGAGATLGGVGGVSGKGGAAGTEVFVGPGGVSGSGTTTVGGSGVGGISSQTEGGGTFSFGEGGTGVGAAPGTGGTGSSKECSSCVLSSLNQNSCQNQQQKCQQTKGCTEFAQCVFTSNCLDAPDSVACAEQNGCQASQPARQAYRQAVRCLICQGGCDESACNVSPDYCSNQPGTQGGPGGQQGPQGFGGGPAAGAGGTGSSPEACDSCQNSIAPQACQGSVNTCFNDESCSQLLNCGNQCGDDQGCFQKCFDETPAPGQQLYFNILDCYYCDVSVCGAECADVNGGFCEQIHGG